MNRQRGAAVIFAMLIAALAAAVVAGLLWRQELWRRQFELAEGRVQSRTLALAGVRWAMLILQEDARSSSIDHLGEPWALRLPPTPLENGEVSGYIADQQGLFNLNDLVRDGVAYPAARTRFLRLLEELKLPAELADTLTDWLDADRIPISAAGAEDDYYGSLAPPRVAANQPLLRSEELMQVRGFTPAVFARLAPYVTALPQAGLEINVNTASGAVLAAWVEGLSLNQANALATPSRRFRNAGEFRNALPRGVTPPPDYLLGSGSRYFEIAVRARQGDAQAVARALVRREGVQSPAVVWQVVE